MRRCHSSACDVSAWRAWSQSAARARPGVTPTECTHALSRDSTQPQIGYAAMLEQFHPTEVLELAASAEATRLLRRHGRRPLPALDPATGSGLLRLERPFRPRPDDDRRPRHRRHRTHVPHASRDGRPGIRDPRRDVSRTALARPRQRRGAERARRRRLLARRPRAHQPHVRGRRHHQEAVRERAQRQGRPPRGPVLPPRIDPALDDAGTRPRHPGRRIRSGHRQARRPHGRRPHHRGRPAREARDAAAPASPRAPKRRAATRARCRRCCACT